MSGLASLLHMQFAFQKCLVCIPQRLQCWGTADMSNSIETAIAIAFFDTIAIGIAIDIAIAKGVFQLLLLLLVLLR